MFEALNNIFVTKVVTEIELQKVFNIRWLGYKKYFKQKDDVIDQFDFSPHATILMATDEHRQPIGTIRILDRRYGKIEIDDFLNVNKLLSKEEHPCAEATRFCIPNNANSKLIKLILWKSFYLYCLYHKINTILIAVRPSAARSYRHLLFEDIGDKGVFNHSVLGNIQHYTYKLNVPTAEEKFRSYKHPLYEFFCVQQHSSIKII
jgi:hypothetical protein